MKKEGSDTPSSDGPNEANGNRIIISERMGLPDENIPSSRPSTSLVDRIPWDLAVTFLPLEDALSCRAVCRAWHAILHERIMFTDCIRWLRDALWERNLYAMDDVRRRRWKRASQFEESILLPFLRPSPTAASAPKPTAPRTSAEGAATGTGGPLGCLLRAFRVLRHLPAEAAVMYSGKYGRHCLPINPNAIHHAAPKADDADANDDMNDDHTDNAIFRDEDDGNDNGNGDDMYHERFVRYPRCSRGKANCPTDRKAHV